MKYALKKLRYLRVFDLETGRLDAMMNDLKSGQFTGSQETVYAEGADGAKLAAFDINKVAGFNAVNGTVDMGFLSLQVGGEIMTVANGSDIIMHKVLTVTAGTNNALEAKLVKDYVDADGKTVSKPIQVVGNKGEELNFIYPLSDDGMPDYTKPIVQAATASNTAFAFNPDTGVITLPTSGFEAGQQIAVEYQPQFSTYERLDNESSKFAKTGRIVIDAWFTDLCSETDVPMQVVMEKGKISGEIDISIGDQAAVHNIAVEAMSTVCDENKKLWSWFVYDEDDIVPVTTTTTTEG